MALYAGALYASALYGYAVAPGSPVDLWRRIYGGYAPWLPENAIPWRTGCWEAGTTNTSFVWTNDIPGLTNGSSRRITRSGLTLPEDSITLQVADPDGNYLEGGAWYDRLAPNALVLVRTTVTSPA